MAVNSLGTDVPTAALSDKAGVPSAVNMCITIGARYDAVIHYRQMFHR